ncbi:hypothetical protein NFI96_018085 [Prochilodus magdalenae]|nr:hypothetical protein NFI96_018085 [Prochilodus magdalenae]
MQSVECSGVKLHPWTLDQWRQVLWSDQSRFSIWQSDGRVWVWWYQQMFGDGPFQFQHGHTPVHRASSIKTSVSESGVEELDWPAQSPDLNLTEHLWDGLEQRLRARPSRSTSGSDLTNALLEECDESRFSLGGDAQRIHVWRHRGQHQDEPFVVTRPEDLVSLHLHPYRTICRNCVRIIQAAWDGLSQDTIRNLYSSIPRRLACWVSKHGGPKPY